MHGSPLLQRPLAFSLLFLLLQFPGRGASGGSPRFADLEAEASRLVAQSALTGFTIALVEDQKTVYVRGFGLADKKRNVPAAAETVYRAGSISKLFTALATMQHVERGKIDLDQAVTDYDPEFHIVNPFDSAVTLRQLMCHRSGLIREPPVGSYFDDSEPTVAETVGSIAECVMVYPPNTHTKYSNIGVTVVGQAMSKVAGVPFADYERAELLEPIGMTSSSFVLTRALKKRLSKAYMLVADGEGGFNEIEAPQFELGTVPAGNLYTTAGDLGRFLSFLFASGRVGERQLVRSETLETMFTPQLTDGSSGFGLGFYVGQFGQLKSIGHNGAVYGFSSALLAIPEKKVGVIVLANDDIAMGPVSRLRDMAMSLLLEAKGVAREPERATAQVRPEQLSICEGEYESPHLWATLTASDDGLDLDLSGQKLKLIPRSELSFSAEGRYLNNSPVEFKVDEAGKVTEFSAVGQRFKRVPDGSAPAIPESWRKFLGSYGPSFIPLVVSERHGHLYAMTENMLDYRLTPVNRTVFNMAQGLYTDEEVVFQLSRSGRVHGAVLANMTLRRR